MTLLQTNSNARTPQPDQRGHLAKEYRSLSKILDSIRSQVETNKTAQMKLMNGRWVDDTGRLFV